MVKRGDLPTNGIVELKSEEKKSLRKEERKIGKKTADRKV